MSSNEDEYNDGETSRMFQTMKKRRIQRACDICRRKKIRCDGVQMPGNRCSNCIAYSFNCTYIEAAKKRGPPKGYVESLEIRLERLEKLLRRLCPDESLYKELNGSIDNWDSEQAPQFDVAEAFKCRSIMTPEGPISAVTSVIRGMSDDSKPQINEADEDDDEATLRLADNFKKMVLEPSEYRFFGKSSGAMLIRTALELKSEYTGDEQDIAKLPPLPNRRKEFWTIRPWEIKSETNTPPLKLTFPETDLAASCIDFYFANVNIYLPLLHRPTFEKSVREGLYLTNENFAHVYLLVCAVGGRFSKDPRVLLEGIESFHSAGWKWFDQVQMARKSLLTPPTLYDLQRYCLSVQFLQGCSAPQSCWTLVGIGIRLAQDVGAHRRKLNNHTLTAEDEMWKRAFWVLVCMDRGISSSLGRPCAIQDEDYDLDLPVDCDDEYWDNEDPEKRFKQPPNKPSLITAFILQLKLHQILAFSLRTIYAINKSKILLGFVGQQWEQHIVAELDSALNKWVDSVPDHLRWDPNREDMTFFNQSVTLYATYYHIQILVHRPFIPSPSKPSPLSFPSLAICTNAARSCTHVIDLQRRRNPFVAAMPQIQMSIFTAGIVLLLSIWGGKRSGLSTDPNKEMADVHKCMQVLRSSEDRWHSAGRLWDILYELASVGDLPLPQPSPPATNKRERDSETPISATPSEGSPSSMTHDGPRNIAGSRRVTKDSSFASQSRQSSQQQQLFPQQQQQRVPLASAAHQHASSSSMQSQSHSHAQLHQDTSSVSGPPPPPEETFALPLYSNELGRLPLHGGITFSAQAPIPHQPQPQPSPHSNFWYTNSNGSGSGPSTSGPINIAGSSGGPSSRVLPRQVNQQLPSNGYSSLGEMSSMAQSEYGLDTDALAVGMMFDSMPGTLGFGQQASPYGMNGPLDPAGSMVPPPRDPSYRSMSMDVRGDVGHQGQLHQGLNGHHQHPSLGGQPSHPSGSGAGADEMYGFLDNDTIAMWSNAPTGFELDEWGTYLSNVSELTHGHHPSGSGVNADGM